MVCLGWLEWMVGRSFAFCSLGAVCLLGFYVLNMQHPIPSHIISHHITIPYNITSHLVNTHLVQAMCGKVQAVDLSPAVSTSTAALLAGPRGVGVRFDPVGAGAVTRTQKAVAKELSGVE